MAEHAPDPVQEEVSALQDRFQRGEIAREEFERRMRELAEKVDEAADTSSGSGSRRTDKGDVSTIAQEIAAKTRAVVDEVKIRASRQIGSFDAAGVHRKLARYLWAVVPPAVFATGVSLLTYTLLEPRFGHFPGVFAGGVVFLLGLGLGSNWANANATGPKSQAA